MQSADDSVKHFTMAGYSGTPLPQKLGIKPGTTVIVINEPPNYRKLLGKLDSVTFSNQISTNSDFVHLFTKLPSECERRLSILRAKIADIGTIWVSWPKNSANIRTNRRSFLGSQKIDVINRTEREFHFGRTRAPE